MYDEGTVGVLPLMFYGFVDNYGIQRCGLSTAVVVVVVVVVVVIAVMTYGYCRQTYQLVKLIADVCEILIMATKKLRTTYLMGKMRLREQLVLAKKVSKKLVACKPDLYPISNHFCEMKTSIDSTWARGSTDCVALRFESIIYSYHKQTPTQIQASI
uniref:Uncharacterized protein n=1 Tax=Glossina pallidipes TaxID=7398 RepID=A0A1A9Z7R1_GLOPL